MTNEERRLRRMTKDATSSKKRGMAPKKQNIIELNKNESMLMNNINTVGGIATTNQQNVIEINKSINAMNQKVNAIDTQMAYYDTQVIQPNFTYHDKKIELLIDLLIDNIENINLTDEQMNLLEIEAIPSEEQVLKPESAKKKKTRVAKKEEKQDVETTKS